MDQSRRIELYDEFNNHPLKDEYFKKKKKILKKHKTPVYWTGFCVIVFSWLMIPGFGFIFFGFSPEPFGLPELAQWLLIACAGLANLVFAVFNLIGIDAFPFNIKLIMRKSQEEANFVELDMLNIEYRVKGLVEVSNPNFAKCGEYDDRK